jgi:probable rRNA maturation factor
VSIRVFYDETGFRIKNWRKIKKTVEKVIADENRISGDLNFILTNDNILKQINVEFLKHNYYTDVICFDYGVGKTVSGEVYISVETVRLNAKNYKVSYGNEILRVIIHGVLHLCGYDDKNKKGRSGMRVLENYWLEEFDKG